MTRTSRTSIPLLFDHPSATPPSRFLGDPRSIPPGPPLLAGTAAHAQVTPSARWLPVTLSAAALLLAATALALALHPAPRTMGTVVDDETSSIGTPPARDPARVPENLGTVVESETTADGPVAGSESDSPSADVTASRPSRLGPAEPSARVAPAPASPSSTPAGPSSTPAPPSPRTVRSDAPPPPPTEPQEPRSLDALLERALAPGRADSEAERLPASPGREEVRSALRELGDDVSRCRDPGMDPAMATTRVVFDGATGRVHRVEVVGDLAWTPAGACIVRTVGTARIGRFARDRFEVEFPYRL